MKNQEILLQTRRLFVALEYGEQLASQCATQQAHLFSSKHSHFFYTQAKQEAFHARFFKHGKKLIFTDRRYKAPVALQHFSKRLQQAIKNHDKVDTLVGQQIVLESFGATILERLNAGLDNHGIGLRRLRYAILQQEKTHNDYGEKLIKQYLHNDVTSIDRLQSLSDEYLYIASSVIEEMSDVFYYLGQQPQDYRLDIFSRLPDWFKEAAA